MQLHLNNMTAIAFIRKLGVGLSPREMPLRKSDMVQGDLLCLRGYRELSGSDIHGACNCIELVRKSTLAKLTLPEAFAFFQGFCGQDDSSSQVSE